MGTNSCVQEGRACFGSVASTPLPEKVTMYNRHYGVLASCALHIKGLCLFTPLLLLSCTWPIWLQGNGWECMYEQSLAAVLLSTGGQKMFGPGTPTSIITCRHRWNVCANASWDVLCLGAYMHVLLAAKVWDICSRKKTYCRSASAHHPAAWYCYQRIEHAHPLIP